MLDALTPIYDQLKLVKGWWFLELLPNKQRYQKEDDSWTHTLRYVKIILLSWIHLLILDDVVSTLVVPRHIPKQSKIGVKVHRSVKIRMEAEKLFKDKNYSPAAKWDVEPTWVD